MKQIMETDPKDSTQKQYKTSLVFAFDYEMDMDMKEGIDVTLLNIELKQSKIDASQGNIMPPNTPNVPVNQKLVKAFRGFGEMEFNAQEAFINQLANMVKNDPEQVQEHLTGTSNQTVMVLLLQILVQAKILVVKEESLKSPSIKTCDIGLGTNQIFMLYNLLFALSCDDTHMHLTFHSCFN